jgi:exodeoxyribonuclease III
MKIFSWNVNGLRAVLNKGALQEFLAAENPDILCLQEIKCKPEQCDFDFGALGYQVFWNPAEKLGYSGTAILVRSSVFTFLERGQISAPVILTTCPPDEKSFMADMSVGFFIQGMLSKCEKPFGVFASENSSPCPKKANTEGRIAILNLPEFYLVNVYTPNSKPDLSRLEMREKDWDPGFLNHLKELEKTKPVVTCGDFNAAHEEIDIARPKTNHHSAGFTDEERQGITNLIGSGFIDTFRFLHPESVRYTWWSHWGHARENNVGWRIDYFFISDILKKNLKSAEIYENYKGSDHCPISIELES